MLRSAAVAILALLAAACSDQPTSKDAPSGPAPATVAVKVDAPAAPVGPAAAQDRAETPQRSAPEVTRTRDQTLCGEYDEILYSCQINGRILSVCASSIDPADISYTYGRSLRQVELSMRAEGDNGRVHQGGVVGQGGGQLTHVRFTNGDTHYIVYSGYTGRLADVDRRWSGVTIQRNGRTVANMECPYTGPYTQMSSGEIPDFVPQETDENYNAWY
jgi:hypothetical protein